MRKTDAAFTLIETLVVIAIITVLMGLLLPALSDARRLGKRAVCLSNLGQIGKAMDIYLQDYRRRYPVATSMRTLEKFLTEQDGRDPLPSLPEVLDPYLSHQREVFRCPADEWSPTAEEVEQCHLERPVDSYFEAEGTSYEWWEEYNGCKVGHDPFTDPHGLGMHPADAPLVSDFEPFHGDPDASGTWCVLFADLHAEPDNWSMREDLKKTAAGSD